MYNKSHAKPKGLNISKAMQNILEDAISISSSPRVDLWDSTENRKLLQTLVCRYQCG